MLQLKQIDKGIFNFIYFSTDETHLLISEKCKVACTSTLTSFELIKKVKHHIILNLRGLGCINTVHPVIFNPKLNKYFRLRASFRCCMLTAASVKIS